MDFAALGKLAGAALPQGNAAQAPIPGRMLLIDGDALAYFCAGNDDTDVGQARINLHERIRTAIVTARASQVTILVTAKNSTKGDRYFAASIAPYQGQRTHGQRPKNWEYLRSMLEVPTITVRGVEYPIHSTSVLEADDLFAIYSNNLGADNVVILTQDKDMRMVPGWHLNWTDWSMFYLTPGEWYTTHNDKVFGRAWFWYQIMHGDKADNIPGLPWYKDGSIVKSGPNKGQEKIIKVGDKWAGLAEIEGLGSDQDAYKWALSYYKMCYGDDISAYIALAEQAVLLWMRTSPTWEDVFGPHGPLWCMPLTPRGDVAISLLGERIQEARNAATQDN